MSTELTKADKLEADVLLITPNSPDWTVAAVMDSLKAAEERLKQIKCDGNIAYVTDVLDEVEKIERTSHRLLTLSGRHVRGEWFAASVKEAIDAIERAKRIVAGEELPLDVVPSSVCEVIHMTIAPEPLR